MANQDTFRQLADSANDGIIIVDEAGRHRYVNQAMADMTGYTLEELADLGMSDIVPAEDLAQLKERMIQRMSGGNPPSRYELVLRHKDGHHINAEISTSITEIEGRRAVFGIFRDVTPRLEAEQALRRNEQWLRAMIENTPGCVYNYDSVDGRRREMLYVGKGLNDLLGPNLAASLDNHPEKFIELIHPEDYKHLDAAGVFDTGSTTPVDVEYRLRTEDGSYKWIRSIARAYPVDTHTVRWYGLFLDIDANKKAEERLRQLERTETIGTVSGSIAHEVYNALYPASISVDKLKKLIESDAEIDRARFAHLVQLVEDAVRRAKSMTESISKFAKLAAEEEVHSIPLREFISEVLSGFPSVKARQISIRVQVPEGMTLQMNRIHASSLLGNLVGNSVDAVANEDDRNIEIVARHQNGFITIEISDSGHGIDSDTAERIFELFFTTKSVSGTGLGLAICRRIVDLYGGRIALTSQPGKSARFTVTVPAGSPKTKNPVRNRPTGSV